MLFDDYSIFALYILSAVAVGDQSVSYCPINCICADVTVVNCSSANVNNATFKYIPFKVEILDLSKNTLKYIPEALTLYSNIVSLNLSYNEITSIQLTAFAQMRKLQILDLSGNKIASLWHIEANIIFQNNVKLQHLNLSRNPLNDLGEEFDRILYSESLISLDASHCLISHIQGPLVLQALPKLTKLDLSSNPLSRLDGLFSQSLVSLDLSNCNLNSLRSDSFAETRKLKELRCSSNLQLNDHVFRPVSKSISHLDASYCALETNYASNLTEAETVILSNNLIRKLGAYAFQNNTKLEVLDLSSNLIGSIHELAFFGTESLKHLDLSGNKIVTVDDHTFTFSPYLSTLNLSYNLLTTLDHLKGPLITVLDISRCNVETLGDTALTHMMSIEALNLSHNSLRALPESLSSYSLLSLDISFCDISTLSYSTFLALPQLNDINLRGNRLVYLKNDTFSGLQKLRHLQLDDNPWKCDCFDENFKKLWKYFESLPKVSTLTCQHPTNVTGQRWQDACSKDWTTSPRRSKDIIILSVIVIVLLISGMIACVVAVKEGLNVRASRIREQEMEAQRDTCDHANDEIRESVRKFTQLPSYDEALLLPKPASSSSFDTPTNNTPLIDRNEKLKKRQSATQTDETIEALLQEIQANEGKDSPEITRRSLQEMEYINIKPLSLQCTEL